MKNTRFSGDLMQDSHYLKQLYSYPINIDFMVREFTIYVMEKRVALFYIPSMTDTKIIEEEIIKPLITTDKVIEDVIFNDKCQCHICGEGSNDCNKRIE